MVLCDSPNTLDERREEYQEEGCMWLCRHPQPCVHWGRLAGYLYGRVRIPIELIIKLIHEACHLVTAATLLRGYSRDTLEMRLATRPYNGRRRVWHGNPRTLHVLVDSRAVHSAASAVSALVRRPVGRLVGVAHTVWRLFAEIRAVVSVSRHPLPLRYAVRIPCVFLQGGRDVHLPPCGTRHTYAGCTLTGRGDWKR